MYSTDDDNCRIDRDDNIFYYDAELDYIFVIKKIFYKLDRHGLW